MLVAGPSGAGYVIPPLVPNLPALHAGKRPLLRPGRYPDHYVLYQQPTQACHPGSCPGGREFPGIYRRVFPPRTNPYVHGRRPPLCLTMPGRMWTRSAGMRTRSWRAIRKLIEAPGTGPRFIACHLFAYCTTVADVYAFCQTLDPQRVKVVRADDFLLTATKFMKEEKKV